MASPSSQRARGTHVPVKAHRACHTCGLSLQVCFATSFKCRPGNNNLATMHTCDWALLNLFFDVMQVPSQ